MWNFTNFIKSITTPFRSKGFSGFLSSSLPQNTDKWDGNNFLRANEISLYVNRAISKRADKVGEVEFLLQDSKGNEVDRDKLLDLLYKPNEIFTGRQFWSLYQKYFDLVGEVYIYLESTREIFDKKNITAMHLLNPTMVTPVFTDGGKVDKYEYKTNSKTIEYKPEQIIYIHNPNPANPLRGVSLLKAGANAIKTETEIATYHSRVLENGGKVEGVFKFKTGALNETQLKDIKDKYQKEYGSAKKAGMPLFLGGDAEYVRTGLSPEELSFLEAKKMTMEDICILTGVPKSMLASTSDVKFDNADADRMIFLRETVRPLLATLTTALDEVLFPDDKTLTFVDPTPENIDQKLKETESGVKNFYMTVNEARERHGLDPVDNGDEILVPFNLMPLGTEPADTKTESAKSKEAELKHPLLDADVRRLYWSMQIKRMEMREKGFAKLVKKYFAGQEKRLTDALATVKASNFKKKGLLEDALSIELEVKIGKVAFIPALTELLKQAGVDALELAGSKYEFNISSDIKSWLENRTEIFLNQINKTTFEKLKDVFEESLSQSEGREQLINRIQEVYGGIKKNRAGLIARTEVHNATQYGTMQGYKQGGLNTKIWVAVGDSYTRDSHLALDGEERPIDRPFSNGLMFPGDPAGPADEVINCRCVI